MEEQRKILILTSKTGGGHISLAEALRDRLEGRYSIELLDPQSSFVHWHYRMVSRYALWLWSAEFQWINTPQRSLFAHRIFTHLVRNALRTALQRIHPDLILTTYPFLTYEIMEELRHQRSSIPFGMLFTDPQDVHAAWLTERGATVTLAPTQETYEQALQAGFKPEHLHAVGWPVRRQFTQDYTANRNVQLHKMGLDPTGFTLFLQGGGEGAAQFAETVERILKIDQRIQIVLATGTNQTLLTRFKTRKRLYALPFTKEIAPFMAVADVIMGKAGPNMLFEAVTLGKPFIATTYIPGQEEVNLAFIRQHHLGWVALEADQQQELLQRLLTTPEEQAQMICSVQAYREMNNQAVEKILPLITNLLDQILPTTANGPEGYGR